MSSGAPGVATVAVIGLGYVGLPLSCIFHDAGHCIVAFDVDASKVKAVRAGVERCARSNVLFCARACCNCDARVSCVSRAYCSICMRRVLPAAPADRMGQSVLQKSSSFKASCSEADLRDCESTCS